MNLQGFNDNQKKAVLHMEGPCVVMAGAGSGKTRVLTHRIAHLIEEGVHPTNILAVTFTVKAAEEMKARLARLIDEDDADEVNMGTFHSICFAMLRAYWEATDDPRRFFKVAPEWWQKKVATSIIAPRSNKIPFGLDLQGWTPRQLIGFIGYQKNNLIRPNDSLKMKNYPPFMEETLQKAYSLYEAQKEAESYIDFDDMLIGAYEMLRDNPMVRERYESDYKWILVDEFQDTNLAQAEILRLLAQNHRNLFVVGDDYQSIYAFRAAILRLIVEFEKDWPGAEVIMLDINYRSTMNIVDASNRLIAFNQHQYPKEVKANADAGSEIVCMKNMDEDSEAGGIAYEIQALVNGGRKYKDIAILYRTNAQSRAPEESLMRNKIPYVIYGSQGFYRRKEVQDILAYLKLVKDLKDDEALERIVNRPNRFLGAAFLSGLNNYANDHDLSLFEALQKWPATKEWRYQGARKLHDIIWQLHEDNEFAPPAQMIHKIREAVGYDEWLMKDGEGEDEEQQDRLENLNALVMSASKYDTVEQFLEYVEMVSNRKEDPGDDDKVQLMTIHRSKGLEFPVVFIIGVDDGILPHANAATQEEVEEERRLCYVAMTRAKEDLYMSYTQTYCGKMMGPSQFIGETLGDIDQEDEAIGFGN